MTTLEWILGCIVISGLSGVILTHINARHKVNEKTCVERRDHCSDLMISKFESIEKRLDKIFRLIENGNKGK